jgi:hypothetical protein
VAARRRGLRFAVIEFNPIQTDDRLSAHRAKSRPIHVNDISTAQALLVPAILTGIMLLIGAASAQRASVDWSELPGPYLLAAFGGTVIAVLVSVFCWTALMAFQKEENPRSRLVERGRSFAPALIFPLVLFPIFLVGFTTAKTAIPFLVGYRWDGVLSEVDEIFFRDDAWRIAHFWLGDGSMEFWAWVYTFGWGTVLVTTKAFVAIHAPRRRLAVFYTAMLLTWLLGGCIMAYAFSAAGPVFAHLVEPQLAGRFGDLRHAISTQLPSDGVLRTTQGYLAAALQDHIAHKGGGISAMPSMHLGAASIYVLAARRGPWLFPALAFWLVIFFLSAYFGYHYWVDGLVAAVVAILSWITAEAYYAKTYHSPAMGQLDPATVG